MHFVPEYIVCSQRSVFINIFFSDFNMDFSDSDFSEDEELGFPSHSEPPKPVVPVVTGKKHLNDLKTMLELDTYQAKLEKKRKKRKAAKARKMGLKSISQKDGIIQTNATKTLGLTNAPEIVTFVDHKKRNKSKQADAISINNTDERVGSVPTGKEITMKEARFQVFKFGVSGMDKKSKEEANTALALRLGAKPEKNKCLDYKDLKEERKLEKEEREMMEEERKRSLQGVRKSSNKNGLATKKSSNKKVKKKGSKSDFKVGSFDGGMLKLSQKDLSSIKRK